MHFIPNAYVSTLLLFSWIYFSCIRFSRGCEAGWVPFSGHCYKYERKNVGSIFAANTCKKENSQLATITTQEQHNFIISFIDLAPVWINMKYDGIDYSWVDGTPIGFTNLDPANSIVGCVQIDTSYRWVTIKCNDKGDYVCQKLGDPVATTSTIIPASTRQNTEKVTTTVGGSTVTTGTSDKAQQVTENANGISEQATTIVGGSTVTAGTSEKAQQVTENANGISEQATTIVGGSTVTTGTSEKAQQVTENANGISEQVTTIVGGSTVTTGTSENAQQVTENANGISEQATTIVGGSTVTTGTSEKAQQVTENANGISEQATTIVGGSTVTTGTSEKAQQVTENANGISEQVTTIVGGSTVTTGTSENAQQVTENANGISEQVTTIANGNIEQVTTTIGENTELVTATMSGYTEQTNAVSNTNQANRINTEQTNTMLQNTTISDSTVTDQLPDILTEGLGTVSSSVTSGVTALVSPTLSRITLPELFGITIILITRDVFYSASPALKKKTRSILECTVKCFVMDSCVAFTFNKHSKDCYLFDQPVSSGSADLILQGWSYWMIIWIPL